MFKVIIAGSRSFSDYDLLKKHADYMLSRIQEPIEIVSGGATGADALGERYAQEKGLEIEYYPADWDKYGKSAGYIRNKQMARNADALIAFWDGTSKGTKHMIDIARKDDLPTRICHVEVKKEDDEQ